MTFRGLINNGCTCYLNACIQALYHCQSSRNAIINVPQNLQAHKQLCQINDGQNIGKDDTTIITALQHILLEMQYSIKYYIGTKFFCRSLGMTDSDMYEQRDANELFKQLLDKLDFYCKAYDKNNNTQTVNIYRQCFEGIQENTIVCSQCQNNSKQHHPYTDVLLPIKPNFFISLAQTLFPEDLDDYFCSKCSQRTKAIKYMKLNNIPRLLPLTLQRFRYDNAGNLNKDSQAVQFPIFLDLQLISEIVANEFGDESTLEEYSQILMIITQPWKYFEVHNNKIVKKIQDEELQSDMDELLSRQNFVKHFKKYYKNITQEDPFELQSNQQSINKEESSVTCDSAVPENSMSTVVQVQQTMYPIFEEYPPNYYQLTSIVCHDGSLNQGHYYSLSLTKQNDNKLQMVKCNDTSISVVENPQQMLQKISGKSLNKDAESETETSTRRSSHKINSSNTGYMYFYENVNYKNQQQNIQDLCKSTELIQKIQSDNQQMESDIYKVFIKIFTNFPLEGQTIDQFSNQLKPLEIEFDLRKQPWDLIQYFKEQQQIPTSFEYQSVIIHKCRQNNQLKEQQLTELPNQQQQNLDQCLFQNTSNQQTQSKNKRITIFIEFCQLNYQKFNYNLTYLTVKHVVVQQNNNIFNEYPIGLNNSLKIVNEYNLSISKKQLIQNILQYYPHAKNVQFNIQSNTFELCLIKAAISEISGIQVDKLLVYYKKYNSEEPCIANSNSAVFQSDVNAQLVLQNRDVLFFEVLQNKKCLPSKVLYQNVTIDDFTDIKSEMLQTLLSQKLSTLQLNNYKHQPILTQLISSEVKMDDLFKQLTNNLLQQEYNKQHLNYSQPKYYLTLKENSNQYKENNYKIQSFYFNDKTVKDCVISGKMEEKLYLTFILNDEEEQICKTHQTGYGSLEKDKNNKAKKQQEEYSRTGSKLYASNQQINKQIVIQITYKENEKDNQQFFTLNHDTLLKTFVEQIQNIFDIQKQNMVILQKNNDSEIVQLEYFLRFQSFTIKQFIICYFEKCNLNEYTFCIQQRIKNQFCKLQIILQKPRDELHIYFKQYKLHKVLQLANCQKGVNNYQISLKDILQQCNVLEPCRLFIFKQNEKTIHFDYNEIFPSNILQLEFQEGYLLIDMKSELTLQYERFFKLQYEKNEEYSYVTLFYKGEYTRIRVFSGQRARDVTKFFREVFKTQIRIRIKADKLRILADEQVLLNKIQYGLFMVEDLG